jgi:ABC-type Mn2+/Zn2+ transport system permease subunit
MMLVAAVYGTLASYLGLLASYHFDLAAGGSIVLVSVVLFGLTALAARLLRRPDNSEVPHQHGHRH